MTAQTFIFFFGGFDSVSTATCFLVHEVATKPDVQNKLREEIDHVLRQPTYEAINNGMKYLDAVVNESLKLYPVAGFLDRLRVKEFDLPLATSDGESITLKPGDAV
ncbi:unnamed protein product [Lasius platythorax]|uniref:Cytochrome P450 n=1 Tax=Lasius platythorax TaxID=488582 RepID=A0AAV2MYF3_9HYME